MTGGTDAGRAALERLRRWGGEPLVQQMAALFAELVAERAGELRAGVASNDRARVAHAAHALKASCGQMGAGVAERLCRQIEDDATTADLTDLTTLVEHLMEQCAAHLAWLDAALPAHR